MNKSAKLTALLFYTSDPINHKTLCKTFGTSSSELSELIDDTNKKLSDLGLVIVDNQNELILTTQPELAALIDEFYQSSPQPLSQSALEVLSIIAYKQPISKSKVDEIRGVGSDQSIKNLINKQLVKKTTNENGTVYHTTTEFLNSMGISSLKELPSPNDGSAKN